MGAVNLIVVVESVRSLIAKEDANDFHIQSIIAVAVALGVKFLLFLYCYTLRKASSQVDVLWEDHRNDLFINTFGLLMSAGGSKLKWWLDPMGAIMVSSSFHQLRTDCSFICGDNRSPSLSSSSGARPFTNNSNSSRASPRRTSSSSSSSTKRRHSPRRFSKSTPFGHTTCVLRISSLDEC
jgi:hypothetical protein